MRIELVVTDLDGTLWEQEEVLHDRTRAAVLHLIDQRTPPLLIATGRRVASTRDPLAAFGLAPPAVVLNGALGLDLASGERFHRGGFARSEGEDLHRHVEHGSARPAPVGGDEAIGLAEDGRGDDEGIGESQDPMAPPQASGQRGDVGVEVDDLDR